MFHTHGYLKSYWTIGEKSCLGNKIYREYIFVQQKNIIAQTAQPHKFRLFHAEYDSYYQIHALFKIPQNFNG